MQLKMPIKMRILVSVELFSRKLFFDFYLEQNSRDTVRQLLVLFINTIFELDILFSKNDANTGEQRKSEAFFELICTSLFRSI